MSVAYEIQRASDGALLQLVDAIREIDPATLVTFTAQDENISIGPNDGANWEGRSTYTEATYYIENLSIKDQSNSFVFEFHRAETWFAMPNIGTRWHRAPAPFVDGLKIEGPRYHREAILAAIAAELELGPPELNSDPRPPVDVTQKLLAQVAAAAGRVVEHTAERQRDLDGYRGQLEDQASAALERKTAELVREHENAMKALAERESQLNVRLQGVDDRSNTHVRRALQSQMANLSDTGLDGNLLARSAKPFFLPIAIAAVAIVVVVALIWFEQRFLASTNATIAAIASGEGAPAVKSIQVNNLTRDLLFTQLRIAVQTLGAGALVWYILRVATSRYQQISRWENELHRFRLDTERAGFLVEGELEGRKNGEFGLPELMVERFSRGLFSSSHQDDGGSDDQIGSTLGHLLGRAAAVKIGTDGVSVDIDKGGLKKARKDIEKDVAE
ncbi:hypothetical protein GGQ80_000811 [Sphingomonas jinjuensis]|uniref:Uncharacterized protein n=1 Tax=Sphingomonas jinjuensis TaxID=535907 RepID=A0A840F0U8_9SPHN|nr:hypothetical protein [Sphingomonas jinjuensis]MBB4152923.1 hypothetical protein [Sphingomonas jinjuensis]